MYEKRTLVTNNKDWALIWLYIIIALIGLVCIFSVEYKVDDDFLIKKKLIKGSMKLINKSEFDDLKNNIKNIIFKTVS